MIPAQFTAADARAAYAEWGANCGPGAIAGLLGLTLAELRPSLGDFESKRYTNPSLMWKILTTLKVSWRLVRPPRAWPRHGLARVQWEGPWSAPGVPAQAAYRHTHWVAAEWSADRQSFAIFDINAIHSGGWIAAADWSAVLVPWLLKEVVPRANGRWHLTHVVEVGSPPPLSARACPTTGRLLDGVTHDGWP